MVAYAVHMLGFTDRRQCHHNVTDGATDPRSANMSNAQPTGNTPPVTVTVEPVDGLDHIFIDSVSPAMAEPSQPKKLELPISDAAKALGISERTLWRRIDNGEIKSRLKGNKRYVRVPAEKILARFDPDSVSAGPRDSGTVFDVRELVNQLTGANYRVGYLQGQLSEKEQQLKLLPDLQRQAEETAALREKLEDAEKLIARLKRPWWKRLFAQDDSQVDT
jgi:hypothetical protein